MNLVARSWSGHAMGTEAKLVVVTDDARAGYGALRRAAEDLEETEAALSRFHAEGELGRLTREGTLVAGGRLLVAFCAAASAHERSGGLLATRG